jgi:ABC-type transporter MlaC component
LRLDVSKSVAAWAKVMVPGVILVFASIAAQVAMGFAVAGDIPGPGETVVRQMLSSIGKLRTTTDSATRDALTSGINQSMALDSLSREALGAQWGKLSVAEQQRFRHLLSDLLEKIAYPQAAKFFEGIAVNYGGEIVKAGERIVRTTVKGAEGGAVSISYVLERSHGRWQITDIELDGQSLADSVTGQIQAFLKQGSYAKLVAQMEEKLKQTGS